MTKRIGRLWWWQDGDVWERKRPETWEALLVGGSEWIRFRLTPAGRFPVGWPVFTYHPHDLESEAPFL